MCVDTCLFADDLAISITNDDPSDLNNKLHDITARITEWCNANKLKLNNEKTLDLHYNLKCHTKNVKFLGIYIESGLGWTSHVDHVANKLSRGLFILRLLYGSLGHNALLTVYYAFIHSHLNYGILLWGNHSSTAKLLVFQKRVVRIIDGAPLRTHCKPLFVKYGILTLPSMYIISCLLYIKNNASLLLNGDFHTYQTRNRCNAYLNRNKFSNTSKSFDTVSKKLYNALPQTIRNLDTQKFKRVIRSTLTANPIYKMDEFFDIRWN